VSVADYVRILYAALPVLAAPRGIEPASPIAGNQVVRLAGVQAGQLRKTLGELRLVPGIRDLASELLSRELLANASDDAEPTAAVDSTAVSRLDAALRHLGGQVALLLRAFHEIAQEEPGFVRVAAPRNAGDLACTMITSTQGLNELIAWLRVSSAQHDDSVRFGECNVRGWQIVRSTSPGGVLTYFVAARLAGLPPIAPWVINSILANKPPVRCRAYRVEQCSRLDVDVQYSTLAAAAEAVRHAQRWTEIHLSDEWLETEAQIPTRAAYPTAEARDAATEEMKAPHIYEI
jgi:hypothetical protein